MITLLRAEQIPEFRTEIQNLLAYCRYAGSGEIFSDFYYQKKIDELEGYLREKRGYYFCAFEESEMAGFLWACELGAETDRRFHILYFAVLPQYHAKGIGSALLHAAEEQARTLGIPEMELNVHGSNQAALMRYYHWGYETKRITLKKTL